MQAIDVSEVVGSVAPDRNLGVLATTASAGHRWVRVEGVPREDVELLALRNTPLPRVAPTASLQEVLAAIAGSTAVLLDDEPIHAITEQSLLRGAIHLVPDTPIPLGPVTTLPVDTSAGEVLNAMRAGGFRHVVLTEGDRMRSVVSLRDFATQASTPASAEALVRHDTPFTVRPGATYLEAARLMNTHGVGCVPVVDQNERCVGIVTRRDLFTQLAISGE